MRTVTECPCGKVRLEGDRKTDPVLEGSTCFACKRPISDFIVKKSDLFPTDMFAESES